MSMLGVIVTIFADTGPTPVHNLSSLDEFTVNRLCITGMTLVSMGNMLGEDESYKKNLYRLHGPIPIPGNLDYEALIMNFQVQAQNTNDERLKQFGRICNFWLIFHRRIRNIVIALLCSIEELLQNDLQNIKNEEELQKVEMFTTLSTKFATMLQINTQQPEETSSKPLVNEPEPTLPLYCYSIDGEGNPKSMNWADPAQVEAMQILISANTIIRKIFIIKVRENTPNRLLLKAANIAADINHDKWENEFSIHTISNPADIQFLLEQIYSLTLTT